MRKMKNIFCKKGTKGTHRIIRGEYRVAAWWAGREIPEPKGACFVSPGDIGEPGKPGEPGKTGGGGGSVQGVDLDRGALSRGCVGHLDVAGGGGGLAVGWGGWADEYAALENGAFFDVEADGAQLTAGVAFGG